MGERWVTRFSYEIKMSSKILSPKLTSPGLWDQNVYYISSVAKNYLLGGGRGAPKSPGTWFNLGQEKKKKNLPNLRTPKASPMAQCKESTCHAGDSGLIPGSGRCPGEGNGNPLQYSCLGSPKDRGAWQATVHGVTELNMNLENEYPHTHSTRTLNPATHLIRDYQYHNLIWWACYVSWLL